jgi:hypothetical protein
MLDELRDAGEHVSKDGGGLCGPQVCRPGPEKRLQYMEMGPKRFP